MMNFEWDLSEWFWGGLKTRILVPFYQYISHIGYGSITRREGMESNITTFLIEEGMKMKHIIKAFNRLWHNSRPRKVVVLVWLTLSSGVLVGVWLKQIGVDRNCAICHQGMF